MKLLLIYNSYINLKDFINNVNFHKISVHTNLGYERVKPIV